MRKALCALCELLEHTAQVYCWTSIYTSTCLYYINVRINTIKILLPMGFGWHLNTFLPTQKCRRASRYWLLAAQHVAANQIHPRAPRRDHVCRARAQSLRQHARPKYKCAWMCVCVGDVVTVCATLTNDSFIVLFVCNSANGVQVWRAQAHRSNSNCSKCRCRHRRPHHRCRVSPQANRKLPCSWVRKVVSREYAAGFLLCVAFN